MILFLLTLLNCSVSLPTWTVELTLPEEKDKRNAITEVGKSLLKLEKKKLDLEKGLVEVVKIKQL